MITVQEYCEMFDDIVQARTRIVTKKARRFALTAEEVLGHKIFKAKPPLITMEDIKTAEEYPELYSYEEIETALEHFRDDAVDNAIKDADI